MAVQNVPSFSTTNLSFGDAILLLGATGATPTVDIGATEQGSLTVTIARTAIPVYQGNPGLLIDKFCSQESLTVALVGLEWNMTQLQRFLGGEFLSGTVLSIGADPNFAAYALRAQHIMPDGSTINIDLWTATPTGGDLAVPFSHDATHKLPVSFEAQYAATDWTGASTAATNRLGRIQKIAAP